MRMCLPDGFFDGQQDNAVQTLKFFLMLIRPFWLSFRQYKEWLLLTLVVLFALAIVWVSVWITDWNKEFYDALAEFNGAVMPVLIAKYLGYIALIVSFIVCGNWLRKLLILRWREHLSRQFESLWLDNHRHYHLQLGNEPDNPDQRIAEDIYLLAEKSIDLFKYFIMNVAKLGAFVAILWQLSGTQHFVIAGHTLTIKGYLVWVALAYSVLCTWLMHVIGHKLQQLNIDRQHTEADYRASLLRIRDHAEQIAFYHGENSEKTRLQRRFGAIKQNWLALIAREFKLEIFSASYLRLSMFIPIFATLPMYLARTMTFGDMMQARSAFGNVQDGFGWFMDYYKRIIEWAAVVERLGVFLKALQGLDSPQTLPKTSTPTTHKSQTLLDIRRLSVHTATGDKLLDKVSLQGHQGQWLLFDGKSGIGKSTLLRVLAGLWIYHQGQFTINAVKPLFLPQKPYLPQSTLRELLHYPYDDKCQDDDLMMALEQVGLHALCDELDKEQEWGRVLSGGQQQRLSIARALLHRPDVLFLDEATNQLDDISAQALMQTLKDTLPDTLVVGISHQHAIKMMFDERIDLQRYTAHHSDP